MIAPSTLAPMTDKLASRAGLDHDERQALKDLPHRVIEVDRHAYLSREGERISHCHVLLSGIAIRHKVARNGARQIVAICLPGDLLDLGHGDAGFSTSNTQSLGSAQVAVIPRGALVELALAHTGVAVALWKDADANASILAEWLLNLGQRDARARIAHLVCEVVVRLGNTAGGTSGSAPWIMTQEQLADATGMTSVHANRVLQGLRRDGLLRIERQQLRIPNWRALCVAGDFTAAYLQIPDADEPWEETTMAMVH